MNMRFASATAKNLAMKLGLEWIPLEYATGCDLRLRKVDIETFMRDEGIQDVNMDIAMDDLREDSLEEEDDEETTKLEPFAKRKCIRHSLRGIKRKLNAICEELDSLCVKFQWIA